MIMIISLIIIIFLIIVIIVIIIISMTLIIINYSHHNYYNYNYYTSETEPGYNSTGNIRKTQASVTKPQIIHRLNMLWHYTLNSASE